MAPALVCMLIARVDDPDIWWHLRTGDWVLQHHAVPYADPFSTTTSGHAWQAYSWLFEVLVRALYNKLGLLGIVAYSTSMVLAITLALYHLTRRLQQDFRITVLLTALGGLALLTLYSPRPWHFTILFFIIELDILLHARHTGHKRELLWLPLIFALWANLHIQFIDGLLLLAIVLVDSFVSKKDRNSAASALSPTFAGATLVACIATTLLNPYGWHIYQVAHDLAAQRGVMNGIEELKAMPFRSVANYCVLFLMLGAAIVLGRARRPPFLETTLLVGAAFLSFRSQRDVWTIATVSIAVLASAMRMKTPTRARLHFTAVSLGALIVVLLLFATARLAHLNNTVLHDQLQAKMPVSAAEFVRKQGYPGPVFNEFAWGGFLMEDLRLPVSIDGRAALHGDAQLERSDKTWNGRPDWATDPNLTSAGMVFGPVAAPLTQLLRTDPRFTLMYEDHLAAVFVPHRAAPQMQAH